ncbi:MAG TPA: NAD(P)-dependent oxidoreductase [Bryobacteraceae bacterium]|nr:NAD(P)-dependent oxidoreductase [Bryobacteraceae bacterium]HPU70713.1 NAD(P)-dependent oxidoreductase [Bryobacteraceae bacterium]
MNIGFIGLGAMGLPMAKNVIAAGHRVYTMFHRRRAPADELASLGATILDSPAAIARNAEIVITIVPADAELKEIVFGPNGLLEAFGRGKVLIEMTTAMPETVIEVEKAIAGRGGRVLDAPVSGGTTGAANATLTIMAGGMPELLEEVRPVLETMGKNIIHVGPVGQGKVVKMVNQLMAAVNLLAMGEAFALGVRCGADPKVLYEVIKSSSGYSRMMDARLPGFLFEGKFEPGFKLDLMKKDVNLALGSAQALSIPLMFGALASQVFAAASAAGRGAEDFAAAADFLAGAAGVKLDRAGKTA